MITHIVAIDDQGGFAKQMKDGTLGIPWPLSADTRQYKQYIQDKRVLVARGTYGPDIRAAYCYVLTHDASLQVPNGQVVSSVDEAIADNDNRQLVVIGGASVYAETLPIADTLLITHVVGNFDCDRFYPTGWQTGFREIERSVLHAETALRTGLPSIHVTVR